jgi:O-antigen/teichoic acid export membrane protein
MGDGPRDHRALAARLAQGSAAGLAVYGGGIGLTYAAQLVLARLAGAASYGDYAFVFAWVTVLAYLAALGFDVSLLRLVPAYQERRDWGLIRGVIRYAETRTVALGAGIAVAGTIAVLIARERLPPELRATFLVGLPMVPVWALLWVRSATVRAWGGVLTALAPDRLVRDGVLLLVLGIAGAGLVRHVNAPFAMLATLAGSVVGLALVSVARRARRPGEVRLATPRSDRPQWRRIALPLVVIAIAETAMNRAGVVLVGWIIGTTSAGFYSLAFNLSSIVVLPRMAVNALFAPMVSAMFVRRELGGLQALIGRTAVWTLLGGAAIALPLALLAQPMLAWFGHDFAAALPLLRVLLIGQMVAAGAGSQIFLMTMTGHEHAAAVILSAGTVIEIVAAALLTVLFGALGAAIGYTLMLVAVNAAMMLFIRRKLGLMPGLIAAGRSRGVPAAIEVQAE